jgi:predicted dehydrogenase
VMEKLGVGIIGCGLMGEKRAGVLAQFPECHLRMVYDIDSEKGKRLPEKFGGSVAQSCEEVLWSKDVDVVIVSTINKPLVPISVNALQSGKHVLCEKPPGRNLEETKQLYEMVSQSKGRLKVGFNHRHHPAISKAKELIDCGRIGPLYYLRCFYGHGGRPGYDQEWRADRELSGGGELLDQGIHVIDLFRWFLGDFEEAFGYTNTYFWDMDVEDNAFAFFKTGKGQVALMQTSWTQWKNSFIFEIFGESGYLIIDGLGGSYGTETLRIGRRKKVNSYELLVDKEQRLVDRYKLSVDTKNEKKNSFNEQITHQRITDNDVRNYHNKPIINKLITNNGFSQYAGGPPDEEVIEFSGPDISWEMEWREFVSAIKENREPMGNGQDGLEAMRMIEAVYRSTRENRPIKIRDIK